MNTALLTFFPPELPTILLRLFLAFIAGAVMGIERERFMKGANRQRGAGFRTYSLVCFGSCLFGLASIYGFSSNGVNNDPGRVAAQVVTGMGFLGAGAIIKYNGNVKGLTTAAGMWVASAIGLLFSAGMYITAIVAAFFAYLTLDFHRLFPHLFNFSNDQEEADEDVLSEEERKQPGKHTDYDN
ncbi:MgtC/SapB family protein [Brevibacillus ruminantium]|uniref:MgtC/SapB family protein n=1 Tax=Brevibacillus ruminantium TaxID=2950604 RepID=A0ABY4WF58_9BACL|nr:MgtC/SapB family protein [Brevibacillus ruminantium]USG65795.1 MgtC/SapB family protein [Brevibacillus ruminantium]